MKAHIHIVEVYDPITLATRDGCPFLDEDEALEYVKKKLKNKNITHVKMRCLDEMGECLEVRYYEDNETIR